MTCDEARGQVMNAKQQDIDWDLYERLVCEFGGIADDPFVAVTLLEDRHGNEPGGVADHHDAAPALSLPG